MYIINDIGCTIIIQNETHMNSKGDDIVLKSIHVKKANYWWKGRYDYWVSEEASISKWIWIIDFI